MKCLRLGFSCLFMITTCSSWNVASAMMTSETLESPNKDIRIEIWSGPILSQTSLAVYYKDEKIVEILDLGFLLESGEPIPTPFISRKYVEEKLDKGEKLGHRSSVIGGERREVREGDLLFNEHSTVYKGFMKIIVRAYDDGVAFCFEFCPDKAETFKIKEELTVITFATDFASADAFDGKGKKTEAVTMGVWEEISLPLWFQAFGETQLLLGESKQDDAFPVSRFVPVESKPIQLGLLAKARRPEAKPRSFRFQNMCDFKSFEASADKLVRTPWRYLRRIDMSKPETITPPPGL